jgi:hypothetical protein
MLEIKIWKAFNWPIDEGSSFKFENSHKWSSWSAFNWSIDEGSSFKLEHLDKSSVWSAFNYQYMKIVLSSSNTLTNQAFGLCSIGQ